MTTQSGRPPVDRGLNPHFAALTQNVLFGDVWERKGLSKRDRSLITVAVLTALYRTDQLRGHVQRALDNGVTQDELVHLIEHVAFYGGWPCAVNGYEVSRQVFEQRGLKR